MIGRWSVWLCAVLLWGCVSVTQVGGPEIMPPHLTEKGFVTSDGVELPMRRWIPDDKPWAVVLALHGMNDYSNAFDDFGKTAALMGVAVYAYDQRGFGEAPNPGIWAGWSTMTRDLRDVSGLLHNANPGVPLYVLGESMGGAVAMNAAADGQLSNISGLVLSAPAVWDRKAMGLFKRAVLWLSRKIAPGWELTGKGLNIYPSDNWEMLRKLSQDPLILKKTRVDAIEGLVDLMDRAQSVSTEIHLTTLVLYGENDQIIPQEPTWAAVRRFPGLGDNQRVAYYPKGWHMLLRDLQAPIVWDDVVAWLRNHDKPLPSGADKNADTALKRAVE